MNWDGVLPWVAIVGLAAITVLARGSVLAEGTLAEVQANDKVVEVYLGR